VCAHGPPQHLTVVDALAREPLPTVIVVAVISGDLFRSCLRNPPEPRMKRRLEFIDDALVFARPRARRPLPLTRNWSEGTGQSMDARAMNQACEEKHEAGRAVVPRRRELFADCSTISGATYSTSI
jgi:hypothetical protein